MTVPCQIEPMRQADVEAVAALEARLQDHPWSAALLADELAAEGRRYVIAWSGDRDLLGYGGVMCPFDEAHVTTMAVIPTARRRRVGSAIMGALMQGALELGATAATLEVRASNTAAQRLYATFGFAPVGVRPGYYAATGEDAIIMWAHDLDTLDRAEVRC